MATVSLIKQDTSSLSIWAVSTAFVLLQFFLQLSSGIILGAVMHEMQLSAFIIGLLSSSFYVVYTGLQIPVGIFLDSKNPRYLLSITAFLCSLGCILFASSYTLPMLFFGRILIGLGSSFAFVGLTHLLRQHYEPHKFAYMLGLTETIGFIATVLGIIGMGSFIMLWGWRNFMYGASVVGCMITILCWRIIPDEFKPSVSYQYYHHQFLNIVTNKKLWINGLFIGLTFSIVTVFGALWAAPFIQIKLGCTLRQASLINALFFLGISLSCPLFGVIANKVKRRKPLILGACLLTTCLFLSVLFIPSQNSATLGVLLFLIGLCCGSYILAYSIANELAPNDSISTCTGFTNTLALITTPLLQPLIGFFLDLSKHGHYQLLDYQFALLIIPFCLLTACILVGFLPEKTCVTKL